MDQKVIENKKGFAVFPSVKIMNYTKKGNGDKKFTWVKHLLFGDWISLLTGDDGMPVYETIEGTEYIKVRGRNQNGYILPHEIQHNRILEVNFVDVGQGDGCHIVTPEDDHYLVDAGSSDNMFRFLNWRYNIEKGGKFPPPFTVVISHSDDDHYMGFTKIFEHTTNGNKTFKIEKVYHNGMVEKTGTKPGSLGTLISSNKKDYITDLCDTESDFQQRIAVESTFNANYIKMLQKTTAEKLSLRNGAPSIGSATAVMEIVGPVAQIVDNKPALPVFKGNKGKTKNGHSIIIKLAIGKVKILLGGDLNEDSEDYLIKHYTGADLPELRAKLKSKLQKDRDLAKEAIKQAVLDARKIFQVDVAKSCHHGSSDFTSEFMDAVNPLATIISSGDQEPHCHPRPDTLGTIGKYSRGERSLIFSTELSRSTPEFLKRSNTNSKVNVKPITKERLVTVYGMINLRTDGEKIIIAQKLEAPATRGSWDLHEILWDEINNEYIYRSKQSE
ncbi:ComEC/Rec2 family competence protein [Flavobacterium reichenbachii]|uniref:Metallo-beta-lactamase domain-containing protein n=1 Tax=Flavobacterium reichenbachii TaxID=362418 RepID=A0A085ZG66_9FLAO|nr:hypothetical protein [Flavobacterium reichenbachii]KFF03430.1 hypothetical protein IW19_21310 [Flavobacterium reichenbachii]OXB16791.1 hypothetical protein B0A68_06595 [Flavobacterium reichenbachii]